jgi:hypothetical protein
MPNARKKKAAKNEDFKVKYKAMTVSQVTCAYTIYNVIEKEA